MKKNPSSKVPVGRKPSPASNNVLVIGGGQRTPAAAPLRVAGWLSVLVLGLTVLAPVVYIRDAVQTFADLPHLGRINPSAYYLAITELVATGLLAAVGFAVGLALRKKRAPAVVDRAKRFLLVISGYLALIGVLQLALYGGRGVAAQTVVMATIIRVAGVMVWYAYLGKSKRVKATYGLVAPGTYSEFEEANRAPAVAAKAVWIAGGLWAVSSLLTVFAQLDQSNLFGKMMTEDAQNYHDGRPTHHARDFLGAVDDATLLSAFEDRTVSPSALGMPRADYLVEMMMRRCVEGREMVDRVLHESQARGWTPGPVTIAEALIESTTSGERGVRCNDLL